MSPIRQSERERYPKEWHDISKRIRARGGDACEGVPGEPPCRAMQGAPHPITGSIVVLTVAHLDHQPENCEDGNLRALCQRCHNRYDRPHRSKNAAATRRAKKHTGDLFGDAA